MYKSNLAQIFSPGIRVPHLWSRFGRQIEYRSWTKLSLLTSQMTEKKMRGDGLFQGGLQRDVVCLCWPIAPSYMSPNAGRGRELRGLSQWVQLCTWSPNKLWRPNSIFKLWPIPTPTQFMDGEYSLATATLADIMPELQEKIQVVQPNQCCASGSGYGSDCETGSRVLMTKKWREKNTTENFFKSKIAIYLSLGLLKERPSCRRSL